MKALNVVVNIWNMVKSHINIDVVPFFKDGVLNVVLLWFHWENNHWREADITILNVNVMVFFSKKAK